MAILKQIQFGTGTPVAIAKSVVAINSNSTSALSVVATNDAVTDNADPTYTIALAVDGQTILKGASGLETALALNYSSAELYTAEDEQEDPTHIEGTVKTPAKINLVDQKGSTGFNVLSSVNVDSFIGDGIVENSSYTPSTGILAITFKGQSSPTQIDLGALLDIQDIVIKSDSTDFLSFSAIDPGTESGGQAQIGVKLADVTYSAASGNTPANLTVSTTNGKVLDASDAIPAIKDYVDASASAVAVTAAGDNYITATQDANDKKKINITADVQTLTATAGTPGVYGADGSQTTAPVAGTLSGTADSLVDGADVATKVKTYVDGAIAIEGARSDANTLAAVQALDFDDTAVAGQVVTEVDETNGVIAPTRANLSGITLAGFAQDAQASGDVAATDTLAQALNKIERKAEAAQQAAAGVQYSVSGTTLTFYGMADHSNS